MAVVVVPNSVWVAVVLVELVVIVVELTVESMAVHSTVLEGASSAIPTSDQKITSGLPMLAGAVVGEDTPEVAYSAYPVPEPEFCEERVNPVPADAESEGGRVSLSSSEIIPSKNAPP